MFWLNACQIKQVTLRWEDRADRILLVSKLSHIEYYLHSFTVILLQEKVLSLAVIYKLVSKV